MNTQTLGAAIEGQMPTIFEFTDRRNSGWKKKGTEESANPIHMSASKFNQLTVTSEICLGKGKGYAKTQYVPNAPVIHVEDMYMDEKGMLHSKAESKKEGWTESKGLKSLGYDLAVEQVNAKNLRIGFKFGILSLDNYGGDPTLLTYLNNHHCNTDRPNAKDDIKQRVGLFKFQAIKENEKASFQLQDIEVEFKATEYIASLRTKKGETTQYTAANKAKIDATLRILNLSPGVQPEEYSKKHLLLRQMAALNPGEFMEFIEDAMNERRLYIGKARALKVMVINHKEKKASLVTGESKEPTEIYSFEADSAEAQIEELCVHFINDSGIVDYKQMLTMISVVEK